uniref:Uncharacterized protein n=1 Tax=Amblyomma triste TaxID=251400 RepID=A0A023GNY7_AMBTT
MNSLGILFLLTVASAGTLGEQIPDWADEGRLGKYQDAWKSLDQGEDSVFYLAKATYKKDRGSWGENFKCVAVKETEKQSEKKIVKSRFVFMNETSGGSKTIFDVTEDVQAVTLYGYQKPNAIKYRVESFEGMTDPLVFSDGEYCDLILRTIC